MGKADLAAPLGVQLLEEEALLPLAHASVDGLQELLELAELDALAFFEPQLPPEGLQVDVLAVHLEAQVAHHLLVLVLQLHVLARVRVEVASESRVLEHAVPRYALLLVEFQALL